MALPALARAGTAVKAGGKVAGNALSNPKVVRAIVIIVILIIVLLLWNKKIAPSIKRATNRLFHGAQGDNVDAPLSAARKTYLESFAQTVESELQATFSTGWKLAEMYEDLLALNDAEFKYFVEYYNKWMDKRFYKDVDEEFMFYGLGTTAKSNLLARMKRQNLT